MPAKRSSSPVPAERPLRDGGLARQLTGRTIRAYEFYLREYLRHWGRPSRRVPPLLRAFAKHLPQGGLVLDLGCGPAQDLRYTHEHGYRAVGLDLAWPFLVYARRQSRRLPLVQADIRALPISPQAIDGTWAAASLIHLSKPSVRTVLRDLQTRTRPGGLLGATFAHGHASGFLTSGWIPGRYISKWRKAELARVVQRAGWHIISLKAVANRERKGRWLNVIARKKTFRDS